MKNKSVWILIIVVSILFFLVNYVYNNRGDFYGLVGDYYYKKNNIELAQANYEKAFDFFICNSAIDYIYQRKIPDFIARWRSSWCRTNKNISTSS